MGCNWSVDERRRERERERERLKKRRLAAYICEGRGSRGSRGSRGEQREWVRGVCG